MIIVDAVILHVPTTVLTFGSNSNSLSYDALGRFVHGYNIMEKIQMVGFFLQELIISVIYIKETLRLLKLSQSVQDDITSVTDGGAVGEGQVRKTMYQLIAINAIIIAMDIALLAVEFANLYLIETTLKGAVYSIKLKLEFAVLGKLVQIVHTKSHNSNGHGSDERRGTATGLSLEKSDSEGSGRVRSARAQAWPDFVDPRRVSCDVTHAEASIGGVDRGWDEDGEGEKRKRRYRAHRRSWIDEEMVGSRSTTITDDMY